MAYWREVPPLQLQVKALLGINPGGGKVSGQTDITAAAEYVPVSAVSAADFDATLKRFGLD